MAVLLGGFLLLTGVLALLAGAVRRGPITRIRAGAGAAVSCASGASPCCCSCWSGPWWSRRSTAAATTTSAVAQAAPATCVAPTIGQAWQQYIDAGRRGRARPVVLVGAQGGGIRAAVWTALVMECIFGPGPVAGSGDICAERRSRHPTRTAWPHGRRPPPGVPGQRRVRGSVGLAAWSARRADLVQDGSSSATPRTVEEALDRDFVAPDVARLLLADLPTRLLAWDFADRAEMLERAWEQAWHDRYPPGVDPSARGLARGLRQTWDLTHADGAWTTPVLAFNGISVEDDCRFLASAVDFTLPRQLPADPADLGTAVDSSDDLPNDAACRGVASATRSRRRRPPLDQRAHRLPLPDRGRPALDRGAHLRPVPLCVADGSHRTACLPEPATGLVPRRRSPMTPTAGIFDNAGSGTAVDTWRALAPLAAATERATGRCLVPVFVQIDNSAGRATISSAADPRPNELTAPVGATIGQVSSREAYSRSGAAAAFGRTCPSLASRSGRRQRHAVGRPVVPHRALRPARPRAPARLDPGPGDRQGHALPAPGRPQRATDQGPPYLILRSGSLSCTER